MKDHRHLSWLRLHPSDRVYGVPAEIASVLQYSSAAGELVDQSIGKVAAFNNSISLFGEEWQAIGSSGIYQSDRRGTLYAC